MPQILECHYAYIMPKYYLINKSEEVLVVDGKLMVSNGDKIALDKIKGIFINIRDQLEYNYVPRPLD